MGVFKVVRLSYRIVAFTEQETRAGRVFPRSIEGVDVGLKSAARRRDRRGDFQRQAHLGDSC